MYPQALYLTAGVKNIPQASALVRAVINVRAGGNAVKIIFNSFEKDLTVPIINALDSYPNGAGIHPRHFSMSRTAPYTNTLSWTPHLIHYPTTTSLNTLPIWYIAEAIPYLKILPNYTLS